MDPIRTQEQDSLRLLQLQRVVDDMKRRGYPAQRFIMGSASLEGCKRLLRNHEGQVSTFEYKNRYGKGALTLEDVVIEQGAALGFDDEDIAIAKRTLG